MASPATASRSWKRSAPRCATAIKPMTINIDGALAAVLYDMGFAPAFGAPLFIIGRVAGLTAEVMEELTRERPMRIRIPVTYDGEGGGTSSESE